MPAVRRNHHATAPRHAGCANPTMDPIRILFVALGAVTAIGIAWIGIRQRRRARGSAARRATERRTTDQPQRNPT